MAGDGVQVVYIYKCVWCGCAFDQKTIMQKIKNWASCEGRKAMKRNLMLS